MMDFASLCINGFCTILCALVLLGMLLCVYLVGWVIVSCTYDAYCSWREEKAAEKEYADWVKRWNSEVLGKDIDP
jgi:hypothetical protein